MPQLRKDQNGFSPVELVIVIVVAGLMGTVGWLVYERQKKDTNKSAQTSNTITSFEECVAAGNPVMESYPEQCAADGKTFVNEKQKPVDQTERWTLYTTPDNTYSVRLPDGMTFIKSEAGDFLFTRQVTHKSGQSANVVPIEGGSDNPMGLFIDFQNRTDVTTRGSLEKSFSTKDNLTVEKYTYVQANDPDGIDIPKGATSDLYVIRKGTKLATVTYNHQAPVDSSYIEDMVKSITIK